MAVDLFNLSFKTHQRSLDDPDTFSFVIPRRNVQNVFLPAKLIEEDLFLAPKRNNEISCTKELCDLVYFGQSLLQVPDILRFIKDISRKKDAFNDLVFLYRFATAYQLQGMGKVAEYFPFESFVGFTTIGVLLPNG